MNEIASYIFVGLVLVATVPTGIWLWRRAGVFSPKVDPIPPTSPSIYRFTK